MTVHWVSVDGRVRLITEDGDLYLNCSGAPYRLDPHDRDRFLSALGIWPEQQHRLVAAQAEINRLDAWMAQHMPGAVGKDGPVSSVIRLLETAHTFVASAYPMMSSMVSQAITAGRALGLWGPVPPNNAGTKGTPGGGVEEVPDCGPECEEHGRLPTIQDYLQQRYNRPGSVTVPQGNAEAKWRDLFETTPETPEPPPCTRACNEMHTFEAGCGLTAYTTSPESAHVRGDDGQVRAVEDVGRCVVCNLTTDRCDVTGCNGRRGEGWRTAKRKANQGWKAAKRQGLG